MTRDQEHLRLLSIFHYIAAGLTALLGLFPVIHLVVGIGILVSARDAEEGTVPAAAGFLFVVIASAMILFGLGLAACLAISGRFLVQHRHHTFCLVVAALSCLLMPYGTVLGVFTIVVLMRDSVRELFGVATNPTASGHSEMR